MAITDDEIRITEMLGRAWDEYLMLPVEHPMDRDEFCRAIHVCQSMVLERSGRREMNSRQWMEGKEEAKKTQPIDQHAMIAECFGYSPRVGGAARG